MRAGDDGCRRMTSARTPALNCWIGSTVACSQLTVDHRQTEVVSQLRTVQTLSIIVHALCLASASPRRQNCSPPPALSSTSFPPTSTRHRVPGEPPQRVRPSRGAGQGRPRGQSVRARPDHPRRRHRRRGGRSADGEARRRRAMRSMLDALSGRVHEVHTAVVVRASRAVSSRRSSRPRFASIRSAKREIAWYHLDRRGRRKGRSVWDSGACGALHRPHRRILVERRRAANCDGLPAAGEAGAAVLRAAPNQIDPVQR